MNQDNGSRFCSQDGDNNNKSDNVMMVTNQIDLRFSFHCVDSIEVFFFVSDGCYCCTLY